MNNKRIATLLAITTLALPLSGCTFVREVQNNDAMGKALQTVFDDENEIEKMKEGNSEVQKQFEKEKNKRELRERQEINNEIKEENKPNEKKFIFRWK